jgi:hypothetical protein
MRAATDDARTCRTCKHAYASDEARGMNKMGFRNCRHLEKFHFVSGINICRIGRYEEKKT